MFFKRGYPQCVVEYPGRYFWVAETLASTSLRGSGQLWTSKELCPSRLPASLIYSTLGNKLCASVNVACKVLGFTAFQKEQAPESGAPPSSCARKPSCKKQAHAHHSLHDKFQRTCCHQHSGETKSVKQGLAHARNESSDARTSAMRGWF